MAHLFQSRFPFNLGSRCCC